MITRAGRLLTLLLVAVAASCTRLPGPDARGGLLADTLPDAASVPSSWGTLVSVTINPAYTDVSQLWFEDPAGRIHLVVYDLRQHQLQRVAALITRR